MNNSLPIHNFLSEESQFFRFGFEVLRGKKKYWKEELRDLFENYLRKALSDFEDDLYLYTLEKYHDVYTENNHHHAFIKNISRVIPKDIISPSNNFLENVISQLSTIFQRKLAIYKNKIEFRVVRPNQPDNNLLHRYHWFPYFKNLLNLYIPLSGSNHGSVLRVVPEPYLWTDEDVVPTFKYNQGKRLGSNGVLYSTPTIKSCKKNIIEHKPDIQEGDLMYFSPMIIHGGGANTNKSVTRFSLEIRLEVI